MHTSILYKKHCFTILLVFSGLIAHAGTNLDSLRAVWNDESQDDLERIGAMRKLAWEGYLYTQPDSAFYYAGLEYEFAKSKGLKKHMAAALNTQGVSFAIRGDYANAIHYYMRSLKLKEEVGDKRSIANAFNNIALVYMEQGNHESAITYYKKGLVLYDEIDHKSGKSAALNNLGNAYVNMGNEASALECYLQSLALAETLEDTRGIAMASNNVGHIYKSKGDSATTAGNTKWATTQYHLANQFYANSLAISEETNDLHSISIAVIAIGNMHKTRGDSAQKAGNTALFRKHYNKAINQYSRALTIAQEISIVNEIRDAAKGLYSVQKALGNDVKALEMYELYIATKDSILSDENQQEVIRHKFQYEYDKQHLADSLAYAQQQELDHIEHQAELEQEAQQRYVLYGGIGVLLLLGGMIFIGYQRKRKDNEIIGAQKREVELQKELVEEKNNEILDSITYAKRIQEAILPPTRLVKAWLPNSFILYKPKDIVAGDFYWMEQVDDTTIFAAADCTGHGVPGAMVSVVCHNAMNRAVREFGLRDPGSILDKTRTLVVEQFEKSDEQVSDGMDIALCTLKGHTLQYAGAYNPLWLARAQGSAPQELIEIKADKQPIGKVEAPQPFTTHTIELQEGDTIYIFSDGYVDQFGGEKGKKFKIAALRNLLLSIQEKELMIQRTIIDQTFENWRGDLEQVDDVCIIGVKV